MNEDKEYLKKMLDYDYKETDAYKKMLTMVQDIMTDNLDKN